MFLKTKSEFKITETRKRYLTLPPPQDASTHQIWNSYLKEYRKYEPDMKWDGQTDGQCDYFMPSKVRLWAKKKLAITN